MIAWLVNHIALALFNLANSRIDAYRILKNKSIAHGINFGCYALFAAGVGYFSIRHTTGIWCIIAEIGVLGLSAFCNRQFSFDIPLNRRRKLPWNYVSPAKPPKAILDQFEIRLFGYNGSAPFVMYAAIFILMTVIKIIWL
ncbi:MAG TPA: hypothetical protein VMZ03_03940 [Chitinophagaceae bacterium]|nr:hypothetical protein [Chitinophagaceae bacterium]